MVEIGKKWEKVNWLAVMIIKDSIPQDLCGTITSNDKAKDYFKALEEQFKAYPKVVINTLLTEFSSVHYDGANGVRDHITRMRHFENK